MNEDRFRIEILNPLDNINILAKGHYKALRGDKDQIVSRRRHKII